MNPDQFEFYIANLFQNMGYKTKLTPKSYDYGVDIIAQNEVEKIAIQVKMYESRAVNYKDIMYLYAGKDFYDCDKSIIITTGICDQLAVNVAKKLNVEVQENFNKHISIETTDNKNSNNDISFDNVWNNYFKKLKGKIVYTITGKENLITDVTNDYLYRRSSTGTISKIEKQIFKTIFNRLKENKIITREEINTEYTNRGSAIITAVFETLPFITVKKKPIITLIYNETE